MLIFNRIRPICLDYIKEIEKGYDLVIGSRLVAGGANQLEWHRRIFTSGASWICRILWGTFNFTNLPNSYRAFTKELFQKVNFDRIPGKAEAMFTSRHF